MLVVTEPAKIQNFMNFGTGVFLVVCLYCERSDLAQEFKGLKEWREKAIWTACGGLVIWLVGKLFLFKAMMMVGTIVYGLTATAHPLPTTRPT